MRVKSYQRRLYIVGLLTLVGTGGFFFFKHYQRQQNDVAQSEMFQAVYYFEQEAFDKALRGDGTCAGLLDIAKEYSFYTSCQPRAFLHWRELHTRKGLYEGRTASHKV